MTKYQFVSGITLGMVAGAALGLAMTTSRKREIKRAADKAIKAMGEAVENISEHLGM